jgi:hypothetical protein
VTGRGRVGTVTRTWPAEGEFADHLREPRRDVVRERADGDDRFVQDHGPFSSYARTLTPSADGAELVENTSYRFGLPWFGWLFALPLRWAIARRRHGPGGRAPRRKPWAPPRPERTPWWAPPDVLTPRQLTVIGLLAAASMSSAFINTLFTQTVEFAADEFGVGDWGVGAGGAIVRAGIVLVLPIAVLADRTGRRRVIVAMSWAAPIVAAAGALAPTTSSLPSSPRRRCRATRARTP